MKNKRTIMLIIFSYFFNCNVNSQSISNEDAFFYFVKIYNYSVSTPIGDGGGYSECGKNLLTHYAYVYDNYNYTQSKKDEFKRNQYQKKITDKFNSELAKVNFEKKFTISCWGKIGEYSFENHSFPIIFPENDDRVGYDIPKLYDDNCYIIIKIGEIDNITEFNLDLNFNEDKAQKFIENRKYSNGNINRKIYFLLTYSIINKESFRANYAKNISGSNFVIHLYSIDIYEDETMTKKIGSIFPN